MSTPVARSTNAKEAARPQARTQEGFVVDGIHDVGNAYHQESSI